MSGRFAKVAVALSLAIAAALCAPACEDDGGGGPAGVTCDLGPGDLLITEVMARPETVKDPPAPSDPPVEWFEVHNPTGQRLSLAGVVFEAGTATRPKTHRVPTALDPGLETGAYLAVGNGTLGDGITGYAWTQMELANDGAAITVRCGDVVVDRLAYGKAAEGDPAAGPGAAALGVSWQFSARALPSGGPADPAVNESPDLWCPASVEDPYGPRGDLGTPGAPNRDCVAAGECRDGDAWRQAVRPLALEVVITEVYANSRSADGSGDDDPAREWFEILALRDMDLNGLVFRNINGTTPDDKVREVAIESVACLHVAAGTYRVLAGSADPAANGGLPAVVHAFPSGWQGLYNATSTKPATLVLLDDDVEVARSVHPHGLDTGSLSLGGEFFEDAQASLNPDNWCDSATAGLYDGLGTPGAANEDCP